MMMYQILRSIPKIMSALRDQDVLRVVGPGVLSFELAVLRDLAVNDLGDRADDVLTTGFALVVHDSQPADPRAEQRDSDA